MTKPRLTIVADPDAAARQAADVIGNLIKHHPNACLILPTGRTPVGLYHELVVRYQAGCLDFSAIRTFNLDEWVGIPPSSPSSYGYFMDQHLFRKVNLRPENCHVPNGLAADLELECAAYEDQIQAAGGVDLALLGIGQNGHIGFNEPGTPVHTCTHVATVAPLTKSTNAYTFGESPVPDQALTIGIATILASRAIVLLATGADKAEILGRALQGPVSPEVPASILQQHPNVLVISDVAAASGLRAPESKESHPPHP